MPTEYLDKAGLEYFWSKLKVYIAAQSGGGGGAGGIGDGVPVGMVMDFAGTSLTVPTGYLACDGSAVSRTDYAELFAVIGTTWGAGNGSTTFNLPDFRGRTSIGAGTGTASDATAHALGSNGGTETHALTPSETAAKNHSHTYEKSKTATNSHTLTVSEIPAHKHNISERDNSGTSTGWAYKTESGTYSASGTRIANTGGGGGHTHGIGTASATTTGNPTDADGSAHNNLQPYATVNKIIKAIPDTPASGGIDLSTTTASLGTTGWSSNSKTINVTGVTASNTVIISPAPSDADAWAAAGIICTAQGSGTLTFSCDTVPSTSLTANILILEEDS